MKKYTGFNLLWVIIIIVVTAVVTCVATGVIMINNDEAGIAGNYNIDNDKELKEFIEVYETLLAKYYDKIDKAAMLNAAEEAMVKFLGDKYTTYLDNQEYQDIIDELSGEDNRIGLVIEKNVVLKVLPLSAAYKAGIKKNDKIISINDTNVENMSGEKISDLIKKNENKIIITIFRDNNDYEYILVKDT